jgi:hypothetical protein
MTAQSHRRTNVFISYSHQDAEWLQRLRVHLKPLEREHRIEIWDDTRIKPGSRWREEIKKALATTKVAVLLVSADFLASDFIAADELPPLLSAAEKEGAIILPVILSPSRFSRTTSLSQFQAVSDPSKPLIDMAKGEQEAILVKVTEDIEVALNQSPKIVTGQLQKGEITRANATTVNKIKHTKLPKLHPMIWVAIIGGVVALITGYWQFVYKSAHSDSDGTVRYAGRVIDQISQRVIRSAKVSIEAQGVPQVYYTDSDGIFYLRIRGSIDAVRIRVEAVGYEFFDRNVSLSRTGIEDVRLTPVNTDVQASPSVTPSISINKNENKITSDKKSTTQQRPRVNTTSDLERRKQKARDDLDYRSSTLEP